ncbi:hypothetical protein LTR53_005290 [Teratosphaeriaceae sp. CCFEE 6253]|nr:hypothetical protein LTR53_005290 [Teratosphaeriaceae sp. CCFEE 6253]
MASKSPEPSTTADILERITLRLIHLVHTDQFDDPAITKYLSPIFEGNFHFWHRTTDLAAYLEMCKVLTTDNANHPQLVLGGRRGQAARDVLGHTQGPEPAHL